ncbi:MAG: hypothetical protein H8D23_21865 [Candidatus Brocadiales bacterium]|nr:hypothetical protein [Candidatus Brocadiales bacterium]
MNLKALVVISIIVIFSCIKEYDRSNPFDPDYTGTRTRIISIHNISVEERQGNLDNIINKGEKVSIYVSIINTGDSQAGSVRANIGINKTGIAVDDFDSNLEWGDIPAGSISSGKGGINVSEAEARVTFSIDMGVLIDETFTINFDFYDNLSNHWQDSLSFEVERTGAQLGLDTLVINERTGDNLNRYFRFYPDIKNSGSSSTQNVWSISTVQDSAVQLVYNGDDPISYGDIGAGESKTIEFPYPEFRFSNSLETPFSFIMNFEIYDIYENYWFDSTLVVIE